MKSLADRLLEIVPARGLTMRAGARQLSVDLAKVSRAFYRLDKEGRAKLVRRKGGNTFYLVPAGDPILACKHCHVEFERPRKSKRQCCSRACGIAWSWTLPGVRERRSAGILAERQTPEAKARTERHNRTRWSKPEEHQKLSEQNRRQWADPVAKAKRSVSIQAAHGTAENRRAWSERRAKMWATPEYRENALKAIRRRSKTYFYQGKEMYLVELAELSGVNLRTLRERIVYRGWPIEEAMRPVDMRFAQSRTRAA